MSKKLIQKISMIFITSIVFLVFSCNQKSFCMETDENIERPIVVLRAFPVLPDDIEMCIFSFLDQWDLLKRTVFVSKSWSNATNGVWKVVPLNLSGKKIGHSKAKALSNGNFSNLTELYLQNNGIGNEGAKALSNCNFTNLTEVYLEGNNIGNEVAKALSNGNFSNLTKLNLGGNNIWVEGKAVLKEKFGERVYF